MEEELREIRETLARQDARLWAIQYGLGMLLKTELAGQLITSEIDSITDGMARALEFGQEQAAFFRSTLLQMASRDGTG